MPEASHDPSGHGANAERSKRRSERDQSNLRIQFDREAHYVGKWVLAHQPSPFGEINQN
ncbi:MAG: hypothetical protein ACK52P_20785 [Alphaproteobacteria bacterium]